MVTINSGVDVSYGRVTKALEVIPSMAKPVKISMVDAHTRVCHCHTGTPKLARLGLSPLCRVVSSPWLQGVALRMAPSPSLRPAFCARTLVATAR